MRYIFFMLIPLSLISCGTKQEILYKEVSIPKKCEIIKRSRPDTSGSVVEQVIKLLSYIELLEKDIEVCRGKE